MRTVLLTKLDNDMLFDSNAPELTTVASKLVGLTCFTDLNVVTNSYLTTV